MLQAGTVVGLVVMDLHTINASTLVPCGVTVPKINPVVHCPVAYHNVAGKPRLNGIGLPELL